MKLRNLLHFFQPKDRVFFELFEQITRNLVEMATVFSKSIKDQKEAESHSFLETMKQFEHQNDDLTHTVFEELNKNFITPFDREDIQALVSGLDDIADYIYASTEYLVLYKTPYLTAYPQFATLILEGCQEIQTAMSHLKDFKNNEAVKRSCIQINALENEADRLLSKAMAEMFETKDAVNIIKTSKVLENLEIATDKAETVANIIHGVMIKYS